jgi:hypothetical protein
LKMGGFLLDVVDVQKLVCDAQCLSMRQWNRTAIFGPGDLCRVVLGAIGIPGCFDLLYLFRDPAV